MEHGLVCRVAGVSLLHGGSSAVHRRTQFCFAIWHCNQSCGGHRNFDVAVLCVAVWQICKIRIPNPRDVGDCSDDIFV